MLALVVAGETIFFLPFLIPRLFRPTLLEVFGLTRADLQNGSKVAQAVGFDDIDFESHEFSRSYCVRSASKRFAYDVCHGRMIEYLLANPDLTLEIEGHALAIGFGSRLDAAQVEYNLGRLAALRELMPAYLFEGA